jgi:hypothetical protein
MHNIRTLRPPLVTVRIALGDGLPADVAEIDFIPGKLLRSQGLLSRGQAMAGFNDEHERLSDDEIKAEFAKLFPQGWAGLDVLCERTR